MSNTVRTVVAKPYYSLAVEEELAREDNEANNDQNPNQDANGSESAAQTTQNGSTTATSDSEDQTYKERWVNLKRYHDTSIHDARTQIKELEQKLSESAASLTPPKNAEELEKFKSENPEMFAAMEAMVMTNVNSQVDPARVAALEEELNNARQVAAIEQIKTAHPDYVDVAASADFTTWVEAQSPAVQAMVKENGTDASAFIRALDLYKLDAGITSANKGTSTQKSNIDASAADAVVVTGASTADVGEVQGRIWTREEIEKLTPAQFEQFEADIEQAWMEGRIR